MADAANKVQRSASQCPAGVYHLGHLRIESDHSSWWCNNISLWQTRVSCHLFILHAVFVMSAKSVFAFGRVVTEG